MEVNIVSDKLKGSLLLTLAAMIWGSSFIVMKSAVDFLTPNVLLFVRFSLATVIMVIMFYKHVKNTKLKDLKGGIVTGTCLFFAYLIQTIGLTMTTPCKNAFLTANCSNSKSFMATILSKVRIELCFKTGEKTSL